MFKLSTYVAFILCLSTGFVVGEDSEPVRIVLAGDSTVTDQAGWGAGFKELLTDCAECINLSQGGRSSRSFRSEGWWKKCLESKPQYVLIQFGHNDQPGKGPLRESKADSDFRDHLRRFVDEVREAGGQPVLITSLTRRRWGPDGRIVPTLAEYAAATRIVADEKNVPLVDLNRLSIELCNTLGAEAFRAYEPMSKRGADHTHLNSEGSRAVARLVVGELVRVVPDLSSCLLTDALSTTASADVRRDSDRLQLHEDDATISVHQNGQSILVYNKKSPPVPDGIDPVYHRSGFLHPVSSPAGNVVTATFPIDHPHQHGIFSAWVRTTYDDREIDFWNLAGGTGRVLHQRVVSRFSTDNATGFEVDLVHRAVQEPVVDVLRERWKISVFPTDGQYHGFDLETHQQALTDTPLMVSQYHYGGVVLRGPVRWLTSKDKAKSTAGSPQREQSHFVNDLGSDRVRGNHEHARWVCLNGFIDSKPVSITVLCHADNFRAPQAARLHPTKPYFCFAPCVDDSFVIDRTHPLIGRYRYLITDELPDVEWLESQWRRWCAH